MVITFIEERKKQKRLIFIFVIVILITVLILWQGILKKPPRETEEIQPPAVGFKKIEIDFTILENPTLKELLSFEEIKPFEEKAGRENPFLPY